MLVVIKQSEFSRGRFSRFVSITETDGEFTVSVHPYKNFGDVDDYDTFTTEAKALERFNGWINLLRMANWMEVK